MRRDSSGLMGSKRERRAKLPQSVIYRPISLYTSQWTGAVSSINENVVAINVGDGNYMSASSGVSSNVQAFYLNFSDVPIATTPPPYTANSRIKILRQVRIWAYCWISGTSTPATMSAYFGFGGYGAGYAMSPQVPADGSKAWVSATIGYVDNIVPKTLSPNSGGQPLVGLSISLAKSGAIYLDTLYVEFLGDVE
jgi:hypothetical protein